MVPMTPLANLSTTREVSMSPACAMAWSTLQSPLVNTCCMFGGKGVGGGGRCQWGSWGGVGRRYDNNYYYSSQAGRQAGGATWGQKRIDRRTSTMSEPVMKRAMSKSWMAMSQCSPPDCLRVVG